MAVAVFIPRIRLRKPQQPLFLPMGLSKTAAASPNNPQRQQLGQLPTQWQPTTKTYARISTRIVLILRNGEIAAAKRQPCPNSADCRVVFAKRVNHRTQPLLLPRPKTH